MLITATTIIKIASKNRDVFFIIMLNSFIFYPALGNAESTNITGIYIEGNQRIETQTILSISGLSIGERYSDTEINNALLFKFVSFNTATP